MHAIAVVSYDPGVGNRGECWWCAEQEGALGSVTHPAQDDRGEVGEGVDADCAGHEEEGVDPDLPLQKGVQDLFGSDVIVFCVAAVGVETVFYDLYFLLGQEGTASLVHFIWEVDYQPKADEGEGDGDEAFYDLRYVSECEVCLRERKNEQRSISNRGSRLCRPACLLRRRGGCQSRLRRG